jgi:type VI secretion system secreted protein Hcp
MKTIDKSSPILMQSTAEGKHFPKATLTVRKSGGDQVEYIKYTLTDVMVSSYGTQGDAGGTPTDSFSLNFAKIEFAYSPQAADGSLSSPVVGTWDLKKATK